MLLRWELDTDDPSSTGMAGVSVVVIMPPVILEPDMTEEAIRLY